METNHITNRDEMYAFDISTSTNKQKRKKEKELVI